MGFDALLKKYFAGVLLALLLLAAYLQAAGSTELLGAYLFSPDGETLGASPKNKSTAALLARSKGKSSSADPILDRNPFDSVTGPLNAKPVELPDEIASGPDVDTSNPLNAPDCDGVSVSIITESEDPLWSFAALQGSDDDTPQVRRVGDKVGDKTVAYVGYNREKRSPAVWMESGSNLCQALLFAKEKPTPSKRSTASKSTAKKRTSRSKRAPKVPKDIADKISKVSDSEFEVDRSVVDKILENQSALMRSARIVPEQKDGKVVGIRMFGIRKDTLLGTLGFQNGDRLESINGFDMTSPEKALEAYARLRTASNLNVKITRRGKPMNVDFRIK